MKKDNLDKMVQETMSSLDDAGRATPAPFLLTRIRAKMNRPPALSAWERAGMFLARPAVAFTILASVLLMNVYIIGSAESGNNNMAAQSLQAVSDEYSLNTETSLFDIENNVQP